jgi:hypothetical protein
MLAQLGGKSAVANLEALRLGYQPFNGYSAGGMVGGANINVSTNSFNIKGIVVELQALRKEVAAMRSDNNRLMNDNNRYARDSTDYLSEMIFK